ncbi:MAG: recombinase family protein [Pseudomonadota bacterium]
MLIGYARASSPGQKLDRQIAALRAAGCEKIYREKVSGKSLWNRPELEKAIDQITTGRTLVVAEWDRATRSMYDGIEIIARIGARDGTVWALDKPYLDLRTTIGQGIGALLSAMAQDERERIVKRAEDGRKIAKAKGVRFGRKPKLTDHQIEQAKERLAGGESSRVIAKDYNVAHTTINRLR